MTALRVVSIDPRLTRHARSWTGAEHRARTLALLVGSSAIERRDRDGDWQPVERYAKAGGRVRRVEGDR